MSTPELRMKERGLARARAGLARARRRELISETVAGNALLKKWITPLIDAVAEYMVKCEAVSGPGRPPDLFRHCGDMDPGVLAFVSLKVALDQASAARALTSAARAVGSAIESELMLEAFEDQNEGGFKAVDKELKRRRSKATHAAITWRRAADGKGVEWTRIPIDEKVRIGVGMVDMIINTIGCLEVYTVPIGRNKWQHRVRLLKGVDDLLATLTDKAGLLRPEWTPLTSPPEAWKATMGGGYPRDPLPPLPLVKRTYRAHVEALKAADLTKVYRAINAVQDTPWSVNAAVLKVLDQVWERGLDIGGLPPREDRPKPPKPVIETEESLKVWKKQAMLVYEQNGKDVGARFEMARTIQLAKELVGGPIWMPHQLDFRGRMYAMPVGLNPQGPDHIRALLQFHEGKPLGKRGMYWLGVHGANCFGVDKVSLNERYLWARSKSFEAQRVAADPLGNLLWTEADKPWSFLAWCFEWAGAMAQGEDFVSHLPIALDGSCNGLQHFSALLRDPVGGKAVNLTPSDKPQDIYQAVADRVMAVLRERAQGDGPEAWQAQAWVSFGIDRKITKRSVMVLPYGGTRISCIDYVRQAAQEKIAGGADNPFGEDLTRATTALGMVVWDAIGDVVVAARDAMDWLQKAARAAASAGQAVSWTTPSGFPAHQEYRKTKVRRVETRLHGQLTRPRMYGETDKLDADKQALGMSPNFVHSLDASALVLTVCRALDRGVVDFAMIHDSYGTHAANTEELAACLREAFVAMYEGHDPLSDLARDLPGVKLPDLPSKGTLDIHQVLESPYFFA